MIESQHYKELSLKLLLGTEVIFRPGINLKAPDIKTIAMFSERKYLKICSYLPKLIEIFAIKPEESYKVIREVFNKNEEISLNTFYDFIALFLVDRMDMDTKTIKLWRNNQYCSIKPQDLAWLFNLIFLISGTYTKEQHSTDNPVNSQAAKILEKIRKAKEKKAKEAALEQNRDQFEIIRTMVEMLVIGYGHRMSDILEFNLFQLMSLGARAQEYEIYNRNLAISMIPMRDNTKDKPFDHWMSMFKYQININDTEENTNTEEKSNETMTVDSIDFSKSITVTSDMEDEFE